MKTKLDYAMTPRETYFGCIYLLLRLCVLPTLLDWINNKFPHPLSLGELNCVFFIINFLAAIWIFRDLLAKNLAVAKQHPFQVLQSAFLGYVGYQVFTLALTWLFVRIYPDYNNINDASISLMLKDSYAIWAVCAAFFIPVTEELFFRGLIFQGLYNKNRFFAYLASVMVFCSIHVMGFLGQYPLEHLLLCFLQYIPAGLFLAWSYARCNSIAAPILIHMTVNTMGLYILR